MKFVDDDDDDEKPISVTLVISTHESVRYNKRWKFTRSHLRPWRTERL